MLCCLVPWWSTWYIHGPFSTLELKWEVFWGYFFHPGRMSYKLAPDTWSSALSQQDSDLLNSLHPHAFPLIGKKIHTFRVMQWGWLKHNYCFILFSISYTHSTHILKNNSYVLARGLEERNHSRELASAVCTGGWKDGEFSLVRGLKHHSPICRLPRAAFQSHLWVWREITIRTLKNKHFCNPQQASHQL